MIMYLITTIASILGIINFYTGHGIVNTLIIAAVIDIISILIELFSGRLHSLATVIIAVIIGIIYVGNYIVGAALGICFETAIVNAISIIVLIMAVPKAKKP